MRNFVKPFIENIPPDYIERALSIALLRSEFKELRTVSCFETREELWRDIFSRFSGGAVDVLEFGVFEGYSIKQFATLNAHADSRFYGFDSFQGLPEDWTQNKDKGAFDVNGLVPKIDDSRVSFVEGWFQNSLAGFLSSIDVKNTLFVHYDADIYSATLYVMMQLDALKTPYYAVFDEFTGHETRALYNYIQISRADIKFFGRVGNKKYPLQVSCKITPQPVYR